MIQSVERAIAILNIFKTRNSASIAEMSSLLSLPKTTVHGLVRTLKKEGFLYQDPVTKEYSLGLAVFELASYYGARLNMRAVAMPVMEALADSTHETIQLAALNGRYVVYLAKITTPSFLNFAVSSGVRVPAHCTSTGKAILAFLPPTQIDSIFENAALERQTSYSISTLGILKTQLDITRRRGYALDLQEVEVGLGGISVPLFNQENSVAGSLCISFPADRYCQSYIDQRLPELRECGRQISQKLGCNIKNLPVPVYDLPVG